MSVITSCGDNKTEETPKTPAQEMIDLSYSTIDEYKKATSTYEINDITMNYHLKRAEIKDREEYKNYKFTEEEKKAMEAADDSCLLVQCEREIELR